jgi:hypothetical protein
MSPGTENDIWLSRHQNGGKNHDIKIANRYFENVAQCRYLRTTITNQNLIQAEIKKRLNNIQTIILPVVLYWCETCSLTLREEHRLRVFENRVLRKIFEPKRDELTGDWRKLQYEELYNLYSSLNIIRIIKSRRMRWAGHVVRMGKKRNAYRILVGKPEGNRPLGRPRCRWVNSVKKDLREIGWGGVDWIDLP